MKPGVEMVRRRCMWIHSLRRVFDPSSGGDSVIATMTPAWSDRKVSQTVMYNAIAHQQLTAAQPVPEQHPLASLCPSL